MQISSQWNQGYTVISTVAIERVECVDRCVCRLNCLRENTSLSRLKGQLALQSHKLEGMLEFFFEESVTFD